MIGQCTPHAIRVALNHLITVTNHSNHTCKHCLWWAASSPTSFTRCSKLVTLPLPDHSAPIHLITMQLPDCSQHQISASTWLHPVPDYSQNLITANTLFQSTPDYSQHLINQRFITDNAILEPTPGYGKLQIASRARLQSEPKYSGPPFLHN